MTEFDLRRQDCVKGMARLPDGHLDLVVTSPPYNLGIRYSKFSDRQNRQSYLKWCRKWAAEVRRVLKPGGSFFLNIGSAPSNPMLPHEIVIELQDLFVLQNAIHWVKSITIEDREGETRSYGHFKPIGSKRFLNDCHEYVFHFTKTGRVEIDRHFIQPFKRFHAGSIGDEELDLLGIGVVNAERFARTDIKPRAGTEDESPASNLHFALWPLLLFARAYARANLSAPSHVSVPLLQKNT